MFLNVVLDEAYEEKAGGEKVRIGMVVIRGNSVVMLEVRLRRLRWPAQEKWDPSVQLANVACRPLSG